MSELSTVLGALFGLLVFVWRAVVSIRRGAVEDRDKEAELADATRADDVREVAQETQERVQDEVDSLSDDDLDKRLREARERTR